MLKIKLTLFSIVLFLFTTNIEAQNTKQDSIWKPFKNFIGDWKGEGKSESGDGKYERSYNSVLNGKYIAVVNKSTYLPTEKNPKGEVHQDLGYISYDKIRKTFVLRQFHIEGFVNQYRLESISKNQKTIVFISENIENIPAGWRAKETYQIISDNEFIETFELAEPNKDFEVYSKVTLKKQ